MAARGRVYLETTVISYLAARLSRDLRVAAHQQVTSDWWAARRADFEVFVSQLVVEEASAGDRDAAARKHIANAAMRSRITATCWDAGYDAPVICTPEELLEE